MHARSTARAVTLTSALFISSRPLRARSALVRPVCDLFCLSRSSSSCSWPTAESCGRQVQGRPSVIRSPSSPSPCQSIAGGSSAGGVYRERREITDSPLRVQGSSRCDVGESTFSLDVFLARSSVCHQVIVSAQDASSPYLSLLLPAVYSTVTHGV
ncbi:hypothetical protein VTN02DRAFT_3592 [Thermoascus thermophilus]